MDARNHTKHVLALREAALLLGGEQGLAEFLGIDKWLVSRWLEGLGHPPDFIYVRCTEQIESRKKALAAPNGRDGGVRSCP